MVSKGDGKSRRERIYEEWLEIISSSLAETTKDTSVILMKINLQQNENGSNIISFTLNWKYDMTSEELKGLSYNLFLKADKLYFYEYKNDYPTEKKSTITFTTNEFKLPFIESLTEDQQPKWSIHLILNNNKDLRKNIYSWSYPIDQ